MIYLLKRQFHLLKKNENNPFFLYLAYTIPHLRLQVPDLAQYENKKWPLNMKIQAAMIYRMSRDIGVIVDLIKKLGLEKNTLIMFNSDNGAHGKAGTLDFFKPSGNLKGIKRTMYEGGLRSPMNSFLIGNK